jgi:cytidylate kinase
MIMGAEKRLCIICAWRQNCQKRFSVSYEGPLTIHCVDFTRDFTIKDSEIEAKAVEAQLEKWRKEKGRPRPCITISREPGAGGSEIARKLSVDLKMDLIGTHIITKVAQSANSSEKVVKTLDDKHVTTMDTWITSLFTARHLWPDVYLQHLIKVIATIGEHGNAIIVGRGAQYILPPERMFRIRFIAPREKRIENLLKSRGCTRAEAESFIQKTENDRQAYIMKYFHEDIANPADYDLIVNTADLSVDQAAEIVKNAYLARIG